MNRRLFIGNLIGGSAAVAVAPLNSLVPKAKAISDIFGAYDIIFAKGDCLFGFAEVSSLTVTNYSDEFIRSREVRLDFDNYLEVSDFPGLIHQLQVHVKNKDGTIISSEGFYFTDLNIECSGGMGPNRTYGSGVFSGELLINKGIEDIPNLKSGNPSLSKLISGSHPSS